jgi:hypothetical protein
MSSLHKYMEEHVGDVGLDAMDEVRIMGNRTMAGNRISENL